MTNDRVAGISGTDLAFFEAIRYGVGEVDTVVVLYLFRNEPMTGTAIRKWVQENVR